MVANQMDGVGEVHLGRVVAPRSELEVAVLLVERVVRDVDLAHRLEHAARLPVNVPVALDDCAKLPVITVQILRPAT